MNFLARIVNFILFFAVSATDLRNKRQSSDDEDVDPLSTDELCQDRPADEYFRTTTDGDCRDVVRYNYFPTDQTHSTL